MINYSASKGVVMDIAFEDGKCQFRENLTEWARSFHNGQSWSCNIAGIEQFPNNVVEDFSLSQSSGDEEEMDSLERWFNRKRIKIYILE